MNVRRIENRQRLTLGRLALSLWLGVTLVFFYLAFTPLAERATTATSSKGLRIYKIAGDQFTVYDFTEKSYKKNKVDWTVNLIFGRGGKVNEIKDVLRDAFWWDRRRFLGEDLGPTQMFALVNDGPYGTAFQWDSDAGMKSAPCQSKDVANAYHYRVYAPPGVDHFVNQKWGHYVVATSHIDHNECKFLPATGPDTSYWAGRSEDAEATIANYANEVMDKAKVYVDKVWTKNFQKYNATTEHIWYNNGKATFINVTGKSPK